MDVHVDAWVFDYQQKGRYGGPFSILLFLFMPDIKRSCALVQNHYLTMDIPDIPDNRKNGGLRSRSALSNTTATPMSPTPTIQLDDDHDRFETDSMTSSLHYSLDDQP